METYSATHSETVEELLYWPWKRFEAFYTSHMKRVAVAELQQRKLALISGIWSNEGFNDDKGTRDEALQKLEEQFNEAEEVIHLGREAQERQQAQHSFTKEDEENPFLKPAIDATRGLKPHDPNDDKILALVNDEYDIDQE